MNIQSNDLAEPLDGPVNLNGNSYESNYAVEAVISHLKCLSLKTNPWDDIAKYINNSMGISYHVRSSNTIETNHFSCIKTAKSSLLKLLTLTNQFDALFINSITLAVEDISDPRRGCFYHDILDDPDLEHLFNEQCGSAEPNCKIYKELKFKGLYYDSTENTSCVIIVLCIFHVTDDHISGLDVVLNAENYLSATSSDKTARRHGDAQYFVNMAMNSGRRHSINHTLELCSPDCRVYKYDQLNSLRDPSLEPSVSIPMVEWLEFMRTCATMHDNDIEQDTSFETVLMTDEMTRIRGSLRHLYLGKWPENHKDIIRFEPSFDQLPNDGIERIIDYAFEYDIYYDLTGRISRFEIHRDIETLQSQYGTDSDMVTKVINEAVVNLSEKNEDRMVEDVYTTMEKLITHESTSETFRRVTEKLTQATTMNREEIAKLCGAYLAQSLSSK